MAERPSRLLEIYRRYPTKRPNVNYYGALGADTPVMAKTTTIRKKETSCQDLRILHYRTGDLYFGP